TKAYLLDKQGNHVFYFKEYGKQKIRGGDQLTFKYQGEVPHVQVWSHERPNLYRLDIQLLDGAGNVLEAVSQQVGFRSMDFHKGALLVNGTDRKSKRLNSSHVKISYAVFCLKKK